MTRDTGRSLLLFHGLALIRFVNEYVNETLRNRRDRAKCHALVEISDFA